MTEMSPERSLGGTAVRHGGNRRVLAARAGRGAGEILDFSASINPLGMPGAVHAALRASLDDLADYPDPDCIALRAAIGAHLDVPPELVLPGNGAEQLIWWLPRLLRARRVVVTAPCYSDYARAAAVWGLPAVAVPLEEQVEFDPDPQALEAVVRPGDLVWIGRPNNPTGRCPAPDLIAGLAEARPAAWWAVDEAFLDFVPGATSTAGLGLGNLITVRSMTKFYALPGLRLGYAVLPGALAAGGRQLLPDWSVSTPAQRAGVAALTDPGLGRFVERTRELIDRERSALSVALRGLGATVIDGAANYLLLRLPGGVPTGTEVADRLLRESGIAVRTCDSFPGLGPRHLRVAVRGSEDNARLVAAIRSVIGRAAR